MIEMKLNYDEESIKAALGSKRYLLESICDGKVQGSTIEDAFQSVKGMRLGASDKIMVNELRLRTPIGVAMFSGLRKGTADWWCALIRLHTPIHGYADQCFLLVGWASGLHGTGAAANVMCDVSQVTEVKESFEAKVRTKLGRGYKEIFSVEDLWITKDVNLDNLSKIEAEIRAEREEKERRAEVLRAATEERRKKEEEKARELERRKLARTVAPKPASDATKTEATGPATSPRSESVVESILKATEKKEKAENKRKKKEEPRRSVRESDKKKEQEVVEEKDLKSKLQELQEESDW